MEFFTGDTLKNIPRLQEVAKYKKRFCFEQVNILPPIEAGASCFSEYSTTSSKELRRLTHSPQA